MECRPPSVNMITIFRGPRGQEVAYASSLFLFHTSTCRVIRRTNVRFIASALSIPSPIHDGFRECRNSMSLDWRQKSGPGPCQQTIHTACFLVLATWETLESVDVLRTLVYPEKLSVSSHQEAYWNRLDPSKRTSQKHFRILLHPCVAFVDVSA